MPSKLDDASNLRFLHACMTHSDYTRIDFAAVAGVFKIQAPAARMRFSRLKANLNGESYGSLGKRRKSQDDSPKPPRKRVAQTKDGFEEHWRGDDDDDDEALINLAAKCERRRSENIDSKVKKEREDDDEGYAEDETRKMSAAFEDRKTMDTHAFDQDGPEEASFLPDTKSPLAPKGGSDYDMLSYGGQETLEQQLAHALRCNDDGAVSHDEKHTAQAQQEVS